MEFTLSKSALPKVVKRQPSKKGLRELISTTLLKNGLVKDTAAAKRVSMRILIGCCVLFFGLAILLISNSTASTPPIEKFYDPTRTDAQ